ncbi:MAG: hypothetical protein BGO99_01420 [Nitrosospira sp. 56-18]|nr:MAG: hypothetical protein BGO99_01420 [Nitrosospira sp. 56-18]
MDMFEIDIPAFAPQQDVHVCARNQTVDSSCQCRGCACTILAAIICTKAVIVESIARHSVFQNIDFEEGWIPK